MIKRTGKAFEPGDSQLKMSARFCVVNLQGEFTAANYEGYWRYMSKYVTL